MRCAVCVAVQAERKETMTVDWPAAFSIADRKFLEEVARQIAAVFDREKIFGKTLDNA